MGRSRVRFGWLGWVVAGVLALTAGGAAIAASGHGQVPGDPVAVSDRLASSPAAFALGRKARLLGRLGHHRRALHGEVTVKAGDGFRTVVFARGKVTAVSASSLTVTSEDNVATTFALNGDTKYGTRFALQAKDALKVGVQATAAGEKQGATVTARRVVVNPAAPPATRTKPATTS
jgi:hypothetical protein